MLTFLRKLQSPANPKDRFSRLLIRGDAANAARDWSRAEADYAEALRLDPLRGDVWVQYGHVLKEQGRLTDAEAAYRAGTRLHVPPADAFEHLGRVLALQDRKDEAIAALSRALQIDPLLPEVGHEIERLGGTRPEGPSSLTDNETPPPFDDLEGLPVRAADDAPRPDQMGRSGLARLPSLLAGKRAAGSARAAECLAFLHLHKTGGLTLHDVLERNFAADRVCPVKDDHLHLYSVEELGQFDFFSGHFDYGALRLLPRRPLRTMSVFRNPQDRLISFYRFHSGHDLGNRHGVNAFVQMANAMTVEEFFEDERIRNAPEVFNHYLVAFGLSYHQALRAKPLRASRVTPQLLERAVARVRGLDAIGITERFDDSVALACHRFGFPVPQTVKTKNDTDTLATKMKGEPPPRVVVTPRLTAALEELIRFDQEIYAVALTEFERRLRELPARL